MKDAFSHNVAKDQVLFLCGEVATQYEGFNRNQVVVATSTLIDFKGLDLLKRQLGHLDDFRACELALDVNKFFLQHDTATVLR